MSRLPPLAHLLLAAVVAVVVLLAFRMSVGLALYAGVFPVFAYLLSRPLLREPETRPEDRPAAFVVWCLVALGLTRLTVGLAEAYLVDYCKPGIFYSEERCALQEARREVLDRFDTGDWEPPDY